MNESQDAYLVCQDFIMVYILHSILAKLCNYTHATKHLLSELTGRENSTNSIWTFSFFKENDISRSEGFHYRQEKSTNK